MSFVAAAIGGSALIGAGASIYAADKQSGAASNALAFQEQAYQQQQAQINQAKGNYTPYLTAGNNATYTLGQLMGNGTNNKPDYSSFFNSPDYQFAQQQGQRGVIAGANARGIGLSGGTLKDLAEFNSGLATQQYGNYFNRLMGISTMGANAAAGLGNLAVGQATNATNAANGIANTTMGVGQAQASGYVGAANAIGGGVNNALLYNYLGAKGASAYSGSTDALGDGGKLGA